MSINLGAVVQEMAVVGTDLLVDSTELEAGTNVAPPFYPQVASLGGKAVYAIVTLTTENPNAAGATVTPASVSAAAPAAPATPATT